MSKAKTVKPSCQNQPEAALEQPRQGSTLQPWLIPTAFVDDQFQPKANQYGYLLSCCFRREKAVTVRRVVTNISTDDIGAARAFYGDVLGMEIAMDLGWIVTFKTDTSTTPQVSVAVEGGSGTAVPDISVEVDDLDDVHKRAITAGFRVEYGPKHEPWGVRRFYVRDPFGRLVNILEHVELPSA